MDFHALLALMVENKASDLFITADKEPCLKINGVIRPVGSQRLNAEQARQLVEGIMTDRQRVEFGRDKECNFALHVPSLGRFRISAFQQRDAAGMVLRRIETQIPTLEELNLPPLLSELAMATRGLILYVGGTGAGKSSSLAAMIKYRNEHGNGHIITIEDPIEFIHPHAKGIVTQREVGMDTESFEVALKNTLRQAPNVILIGEVRSRETMQYAITFAETGHLCLATLHSNNADQALERILNFFPEERHTQLLLDLSLNLQAIIAQQLVRSSDGKSRYPAVEILLNTPLAADTIRKGDIHKLKDVMKNSRELGMQTFDQALLELYVAGKIGYEEALAAADSQNEVRLAIKFHEQGLAGNPAILRALEDGSNPAQGAGAKTPILEPGEQLAIVPLGAQK